LDHDEGLALLGQEGWLSKTPAEFREAILSRCSWQHVEAGKLIQTGGEEDGELVGLAQGVVEFRTVLGRADTPLMHFVHPVFWFGFVPILSGQPRPVAATTRTDVQLARVPRAEVRALLDRRPDWWHHLMPLAITYGDVASRVAADLLIRNSERRCAAVLLRLSGHRFTNRQGRHEAEIGITQEELAGAANLSHSSVHGILKRLADRGLVELRYRGLQILDASGLRAFADQD
jgi:CRP/FNR family cyclic AMP-dependent transcriptional regulator